MDAMDSYPSVAVSGVGAAPRNLESEHQSDSVDHGLHRSSCMKNQGTESHRDGLKRPRALFALLKVITKSLHEERKIGSGGFGEVYRGVRTKSIAVKKLCIQKTFDDALFHQSVQSLRHPTCKYCNAGITVASCGWRKIHQIIKPNCERSHHSHKDHTIQFSNILLDENLEPRIYDTDVSRPVDQNHICDPQFVNQMYHIDQASSWRDSFDLVQSLVLAILDGMKIFHPDDVSVVSVAQGQKIKRNNGIRCPLVKMLLFGKEIKVPVSRRSLNRKTRYLKWNGTYRRCSSLLILTEASTKKKTVASGNGKGDDNGSSEEVSSYQANQGLNASVETPMSQSERTSISRPDETATVDISSGTPSRTLESTWYIVSAAPHHMTGVLDLLANYMPMSGGLDVHTPNMGRMQVLGSGSVDTGNIRLQDVWYVPGLDANLVSTSQLTKLGHTVSLGPDGCRIKKDSGDGAVIGSAHFTDDYLFKVDFLNDQPTN